MTGLLTEDVSQAAAREYPDIVRLLGRTIPSDESSSSDG
jgi:hypothetical protein